MIPTAHLLEWLKLVEPTIPIAGQMWNSWNFHAFAGENAIYSQFGKRFGNFMKSNIHSPKNPAISRLSVYPFM